MDRDRLVDLLAAGNGEAYEACRRQVACAVSVTVSDGSAPANHFERIYRVREQHTREVGIPTAGFRETVDRLRALGEQTVRVGTVKIAQPPYHYALFVSDDLSNIVGCLGVDQQPRPPGNDGRLAVLSCEAVAWVSDDFPGWVRVRLVDADGREWFFVDNVPVFTADVITAETPFPILLEIRCRVLTSGASSEHEDLLISTDVDGLAAQDGTKEFRVRRDQVRER